MLLTPLVAAILILSLLLTPLILTAFPLPLVDDISLALRAFCFFLTADQATDTASPVAKSLARTTRPGQSWNITWSYTSLTFLNTRAPLLVANSYKAGKVLPQLSILTRLCKSSPRLSLLKVALVLSRNSNTNRRQRQSCLGVNYKMLKITRSVLFPRLSSTYCLSTKTWQPWSLRYVIITRASS
jgi:hypothetical protein